MAWLNLCAGLLKRAPFPRTSAALVSALLITRISPAHPPHPPTHTHTHTHTQFVNRQEMTDPAYDEYSEKWQYLKVQVKGVFDYRVRLPRGLQHKLIPEIQVEVPAFEQTRSAVETQFIGGECV